MKNKHLKSFNEINENMEAGGLPDGIKSEIKMSFENTVMCARTNSPKDSYEYAERMANHVIRLIEENRK